jgi:hypothetical protein
MSLDDYVEGLATILGALGIVGAAGVLTLALRMRESPIAVPLVAAPGRRALVPRLRPKALA